MASNTTTPKKKAVSRQNNTGRTPQRSAQQRGPQKTQTRTQTGSAARPRSQPQRTTQSAARSQQTASRGPQQQSPRSAPRSAGTRTQQRAQPQQTRRKKTPEEIAAERKRAEAEAKRRKQQRKDAFRKAVTVFLYRLIVVGIFFGIIVTVGVIGIAFDLLTGNAERSRPWREVVVQTLNEDEDNPESDEVEVPGNWAYIDGVCYLNFSRIAALYDLTLTGDAGEIRYLLDDAEGQSVRFSPGSGWFAVNDTPCRCAARIYQRGEDIYVPVSIAEYYLEGITVYEDTVNRTVVITRICDTDPETFIPLSFTLHKDDPDPHIVEKLLDADILAATDPYAFSEIPDNYME